MKSGGHGFSILCPEKSKMASLDWANPHQGRARAHCSAVLGLPFALEMARWGWPVERLENNLLETTLGEAADDSWGRVIMLVWALSTVRDVLPAETERARRVDVTVFNPRRWSSHNLPGSPTEPTARLATAWRATLPAGPLEIGIAPTARLERVVWQPSTESKLVERLEWFARFELLAAWIEAVSIASARKARRNASEIENACGWIVLIIFDDVRKLVPISRKYPTLFCYEVGKGKDYVTETR